MSVSFSSGSPSIEAEYRERLATRLRLLHTSLNFGGRQQDPSLVDLFVDLRLNVTEHDWEIESAAERAAAPRQKDAAQGPRSALEYIDTSGRRSLVILGDPGSGKTTLLRYLALLSAKKPAELPGGRSQLPIFIPLAAYQESKYPRIVNFITNYFNDSLASPIDGLPSLLQSSLDNGRALVLLDGLDELLNKSERSQLAQKINSLLFDYAKRGNQFIITSRIVGYSDLPIKGIPEAIIQEFNQDDIRRFCENFYIAVLHGQSSPAEDVSLKPDLGAEKFMQALERRPELLRIAVNPLLLTMILSMYDRNGFTAENRVRLYDKYTTMMLTNTWERIRSESARPEEPARAFSVDSARLYLSQMALSWHKSGQDIKKRERCKQDLALFMRTPAGGVLESRQAEAAAASFLQEIQEFSGILIERGAGVIGFAHMTFKEFFVGYAMAELPGPERLDLLKQFLYAPRWREPLLLCLGCLSEIREDKSELNTLISAIFDNEDPYGEQLHRQTLLLAAIIAENIAISDEHLDRGVEKILQLFESEPGTCEAPFIKRQLVQALTIAATRNHKKADKYVKNLLQAPQQIQNLRVFAESIGSSLRYGGFDKFKWHIVSWFDHPSDEAQQAAAQILSNFLSGDRHLLQKIIEKISRKTVVFDPKSDLRRHRWTDKGLGRQAEIIATLAQHSPALLDNPRVLDTLRGLVRLPQQQPLRFNTLRALAPLGRRDPRILALLLWAAMRFPDAVPREAIVVLASWIDRRPSMRRTLPALLRKRSAPVARQLASELATYAATRPALRMALIERARALVSDEDLGRQLLIALAPLLKRLPEEMPGSVADGLDEGWLRAQLVAALDGPHAELRRAAIEALAPSCLQDAALQPRLRLRLTDENAEVVHAALAALATYGHSDEELITDAHKLVKHESAEVQDLAIQLLVQHRTRHKSAQAIVRSLLADTQARIRAQVLRELAHLPEEEQDLWEAARQLLLNDLEEQVQIAAAKAIGQIDPSEPEVRDFLLAAINKGQELRDFVLRALVPLLAQGDEAVHIGFTRELNRCKTDETVIEMAEAIEPLLKEDAALRRRVAEKLVSVKHIVQNRLLTLLAPYAAIDPEIRRAFGAVIAGKGEVLHPLKLVGELVSKDQALFDQVFPRMWSHDYEVQRAAIQSLAPRAAEHKPLRDALLATIRDENHSWVRHDAIDALKVCVPADDEVCEALLAIVEDRDRDSSDVVHAILSLAEHVPRSNRCMQTVMRRIDDNGDVHGAALSILALHAAEKPEVQAALLKLTTTDSDSDEIDASLVASVVEIARRFPDFRKVLLERLDDAELCTATLLSVLAFLASTDRSIRCALLRRRRVQPLERRALVMAALMPSAIEDRAVRSLFLRQLAHQDAALRIHAVALLVPCVEKDIAEVIEAIVVLAGSEDESFRMELLKLLVDRRLTLEQAHRLTAACRDPSDEIRHLSTHVLAAYSADPVVRAALVPLLDDQVAEVRECARTALGAAAANDAALRARMLGCIEECKHGVRTKIIHGLAPLVRTDATVRTTLRGFLAHPDWKIRMQALRVLAAEVGQDPALREELLPWIGVEKQGNTDSDEEVDSRRGISVKAWRLSDMLVSLKTPDRYTLGIRRFLAEQYAPLLADDQKLYGRVLAYLDSPSAAHRHGAAWALLHMPGGPPPEVQKKIESLIDDTRTGRDWPRRLQVARLVFEAGKTDLAEDALRTVLQALDHGTDPWLHPETEHAEVRRLAISTLGDLSGEQMTDSAPDILQKLISIIKQRGVDSSLKDTAYRIALQLAERERKAQPSTPVPSDHIEKRKNMATIGVVIALFFEMKIFIEAIKANKKKAKEVRWDEDPNGQNFAIFEYTPPPPARPLQIVVAFVAEMNPAPTQRVTQQMIVRYQPDGIAMLGIAGALDDELLLGDVVYVDQVTAYMHSTAATPVPPPHSEVQEPKQSDLFHLDHGGKSSPTSKAVLHALDVLPFKHEELLQEWQAACAQRWQSLQSAFTDPSPGAESQRPERFVRTHPQIEKAPLASGPILIKAQAAKKWLKEQNRKYFAVEMESAGLMEGIEINQEISVLILRGISDFANESKAKLEQLLAHHQQPSEQAKIFRRYAMSNVVSLFFLILDLGLFPERKR